MNMKKYYMQPCVEATQLQLSSIVLAGSSGALQNSEQGTDVITTPPGGEIIGG